MRGAANKRQKPIGFIFFKILVKKTRTPIRIFTSQAFLAPYIVQREENRIKHFKAIQMMFCSFLLDQISINIFSHVIFL